MEKVNILFVCLDKPQEKVCVTDFATKVSSEILNKAMVIAKDSPDNPSAESENSSDVTVVCQTHDTTNPCSCGSAPRYEIQYIIIMMITIDQLKIERFFSFVQDRLRMEIATQ